MVSGPRLTSWHATRLQEIMTGDLNNKLERASWLWNETVSENIGSFPFDENFRKFPVTNGTTFFRNFQKRARYIEIFGNFRSIWSFLLEFRKFSVKWFAFRKFENFRISRKFLYHLFPFRNFWNFWLNEKRPYVKSDIHFGLILERIRIIDWEGINLKRKLLNLASQISLTDSYQKKTNLGDRIFFGSRLREAWEGEEGWYRINSYFSCLCRSIFYNPIHLIEKQNHHAVFVLP